MATKLFLRNTQAAKPNVDLGIIGVDDVYDMLAAAGASVDTAVVDTQAGGTQILLTKTAGGSTIAFVSGRVPSGGFTLTTTDVDQWWQESHMNANAGGRYQVFKYTPGSPATLTLLGGGPFSDGVEFSSTGPASMTWIGNVNDHAFAEDTRIVLKVYITNVGTMAAGHTCTLSFNAADASDGDSFFNIAETVAFKAEEVAGTLSVTLDGLTPAATGAVDVVGTASETLDGVTVDLDGAVEVQGAATKTLDTVALAAEGTVEASGITGVLAVTLDDVSRAAAGTVEVQGAATPTLAGLGLSSAGEADVAGAAAVTLEAASVAGTGTVDVAGALAAALADLTASGAGAVEVLGESALALAAVVVAAAGAVEVQGIAGPTLEAAALVADGVVTNPGDKVGTLDVTLEGIGFGAAGVIPIEGEAVPTLAGIGLEAAGAVAIEGTLARTLAALVVSAAGLNGETEPSAPVPPIPPPLPRWSLGWWTVFLPKDSFGGWRRGGSSAYRIRRRRKGQP